jgi:hypothetical protein
MLINSARGEGKLEVQNTLKRTTVVIFGNLRDFSFHSLYFELLLITNQSQRNLIIPNSR